MPKITISNGSALGYVASGSANGVPIVFLHGVGSDKSAWRPQLAHFGQERVAAAFDYPGYGDSDPAPDGMTRDDFALAVISGMERLGIGSAHVCGLSLGGVIAIAMYNAAPERVASLVLADSFAFHPDGQSICERSMLGSHDLPAMAEARVDSLLAPSADPQLRREILETMVRIDPAAYRIGAQAVWLADQRGRASTIKAPTLIVVGDHDTITPPRLSEQLLELIPRSRMEVIQGAGHLSNLEQPLEFNRIVGKFIRDAEGSV